ncbi:hypothetical protein AYO28_20150 [Pseudomonas putida]|uniref:Uncharacterized protein n=1 Tax=Pseudomonas putida TaxID=303 RepID=A0A177SN59_PSEPU|nr:hypothetical protein AYO28_20150 [Pseudomonas putida]
MKLREQAADLFELLLQFPQALFFLNGQDNGTLILRAEQAQFGEQLGFPVRVGVMAYGLMTMGAESGPLANQQPIEGNAMFIGEINAYCIRDTVPALPTANGLRAHAKRCREP